MHSLDGYQRTYSDEFILEKVGLALNLIETLDVPEPLLPTVFSVVIGMVGQMEKPQSGVAIPNLFPDQQNGR